VEAAALASRPAGGNTARHVPVDHQLLSDVEVITTAPMPVSCGRWHVSLCAAAAGCGVADLPCTATA